MGVRRPVTRGLDRDHRSGSGRDDLPITLVAVDDQGSAVGAVALGETDHLPTDVERDGRTPWLLGMVVRRDRRRRGTGRRLVGALEDLASARGYEHVRVVTGVEAVGFYRASGWTDAQQLVTGKEQIASTVLTRSLVRE